jgi:Na+/H+-dicarboxylate symporter
MSDSFAANQGTGIITRWHHTPLYLRIIGALILGVIFGFILGPRAEGLAMPSRLVLRLLSALAPALIFIAIVHALMTAELHGRTTMKMIGLLVLNTLVAICVGLLVANVIQPGRHGALAAQETATTDVKPAEPAPTTASALDAPLKQPDILAEFLENVPKSLLGPLTDNGKVLGVIFFAVAFGIAFRKEKNAPIATLQDVVELILRAFITILHWIIDIIPFAIFGIVASIIGTKGLAAFHSLGVFVLSVLVALFLQATYYLARVRFGSWVKPLDLLRGGRDALVMAFSTASSTATMPVTYEALKNKVGLRDQSASMGSLVGANFNNDGTALYEAMSALFIAQMIGQDLSLAQQFMVVITSIIASVGAAGIPEAGLVTMTLVFTAVGLPVDRIPLLLTVDWFLDRCRTAINVMGDMNVSCLLDGKVRAEPDSEPVTS